jgi:bla regulator protein blaR1
MTTIVDSFVTAVSWTFLHSLWQGLILAIIGAGIVFLLPAQKSILKHNLLSGAILLFIVVNLLTFRQYFDFPFKVAASDSSIKETLATNLALNTQLVSKSYMDIGVRFVNNHANEIFMLWAVIFVWKMILLFNGIIFVQKLKRNGKQLQNLNVLKEIQARLNIKRTIDIYESAFIKVPAVSGYIKPILFLPIGFFNQMNSKEAEAVLMHELAHIRRSDFLINIFQIIIESVYFFNLPLLYVSNLLKEERENCCDDLALKAYGDKKSFVEVLIFWNSRDHDGYEIVMSFNGGRMSMLSRVNRILFNKNTPFRSMEKLFIGACFLFTTFSGLIYYFVRPENFQKGSLSEVTQAVETTTDSEKTKSYVNGFTKMDSVPVCKLGGHTNLTGETNTIFDGKAFRIKLKNSVVTELYIDGQKIPENKIMEYKLAIDKIHERMVKNSEEQAIRDNEEAMSDQQQAVKDKEQVTRDQEQAVRDSEQARRDREQVMKDQEQAVRDSEQARRDSEQAMKDSEQAAKEMDKIIQELIKDKIITSRENLSFLLSKEKFIINDKNQSIEIVNKYFAKYGVKGLSLVYNWRTDW